MAIPTYEIYAVKYGGLTSPPGLHGQTGSRIWIERPRSITTSFVIRGGGETIVVDCGVHPDVAKQRNLASYLSPADALKRIDIDAAKVKHLIVTHVHFDQRQRNPAVPPRPRIYIQEKEFNFWVKDPIARRAPFLLVTDSVANRYLAKQAGKKGFASSGEIKNPSGDRAPPGPRPYHRPPGRGGEILPKGRPSSART